MEIKTVQEFFEDALPSRFKPEKAKDIHITVQINITGNNSSDWFVIIKEQKLQVVQGIFTEPTLTFRTAETIFLELVNSKISIESAFFRGKINFEGDITTALKLKATGFL